MLPEDFRWERVTLHDAEPTLISYRGMPVCRLMQRVDDETWYAYLDYQRPGGPSSWIRRNCSSFEQGHYGCELWVTRHQVRLRQEAGAMVDAMDARRRF